MIELGSKLGFVPIFHFSVLFARSPLPVLRLCNIYLDKQKQQLAARAAQFSFILLPSSHDDYCYLKLPNFAFME